MSEEIQLPYSDLYHGDWRMGCNGFTAQQEGIYMRLYTNLGTLNGRGLPNDFVFDRLFNSVISSLFYMLSI
jgi:hypothetical protein